MYLALLFGQDLEKTDSIWFAATSSTGIAKDMYHDASKNIADEV